MWSRIIKHFKAVPGLLLLMLLIVAPGVSSGGGTCTSCGGSGDRMELYDIAVDAFGVLLTIQKLRPIVLPDGTRCDVEKLFHAITDALDQHDLIVVDSQSDQECPLKDDTGTCVEFLSVPATGQLSVDIGRLRRHRSDQAHLRRQMIHEAFRMAREDDWLYQDSRRLEELVEETLSCGAAPDADSRRLDELTHQVGSILSRQQPQVSLRTLTSGAGSIRLDTEGLKDDDGDLPCADPHNAERICRRIREDLVPASVHQYPADMIAVAPGAGIAYGQAFACYLVDADFAQRTVRMPGVLRDLRCVRGGSLLPAPGAPAR